jgi:endonuclease YncB( thermonuclease family)
VSARSRRKGQDSAYARTLACLVVGIADGDTLTARCDAPDGQVTIQVRLAEIDAPEKRQPFGERSKQHLSALCFQKSVVVRPKTRDRYGRMVARVACDGADASVEQVRAGMAWAFTKYQTDHAFTPLEADARSRHVGLWTDRTPTPPWDWRYLAKH